MKIDVLEKQLKGFNRGARKKLESEFLSYATDLIEEANRIESARNTAGGEPEVTSSMVNDASNIVRMGLSQSRRSIPKIIIRVLAPVLSLVVAAMYDSSKLQSADYMLLFVLVITAAIFALTISAFWE